MRRSRTSIIVLGILLPVNVCNAQDNKDLASAAASVQAFYKIHFAHNMGFSEGSVRRKKNWLTPELYTMVLTEVRKPGDPDVVPPIDGDPFTNSQEYPTGFTVVKTVARSKTSAETTIRFTGQDHRVTVRLVKLESKWLIDDIVYENGETLRQLLREEK